MNSENEKEPINVVKMLKAQCVVVSVGAVLDIIEKLTSIVSNISSLF